MKRQREEEDQEGLRHGDARYSNLDEETLKYYKEIDAHFKTLDDDEEKQLLADNVLSETEGREADIVPDATCSRVLEHLIPHATSSSLEKFTRRCIEGENLGLICTSGPFGSHVLEKLLNALSSRASTLSDEDSYTLVESSLTAFTEASISNLYDMITSKYGSFVARRLVCVLCGRDVAKPPPSRHTKPLLHDANAAANPSNHHQPHYQQQQQGTGLENRIMTASAVRTTTTRDAFSSYPSSASAHTAHNSNGSGGNGSGASTLSIPFPALLNKIAIAVISDDWIDPSDLIQVQSDAFAGPFLQSLLRAIAYTAEDSVSDSPQQQKLLLGRLIVRLLGGKGAAGSGIAAKPSSSYSAAAITNNSSGNSINVDSIAPDTLLRLLTDRNGSHLMEAIFETSPDDILQKLCTAAFRGRLAAMAQHPSANFAVQAALASVRKPQQLKRMFEDVRPHLTALLKGRRAGVVAVLLAAAKRLNTLETDCADALWHAVDSGLVTRSDPSDSVSGSSSSSPTPLHALLILDTTNASLGSAATTTGKTPSTTQKAAPNTMVQYSSGSRLSSLGCAMLISIFQYPQESIKKWTDALLDLSPTELIALAKDPGGCRVIETYLEGPGGAPKKKRKIIQNLAGSWGSIAMTKAGSRFVEKCYVIGDIGEKESIASELAAAESRIMGLPWGNVVLRNCSVGAFISNGGDWQEKVAKADMTRREFADLFGAENDDDDVELETKKKKKEKKKEKIEGRKESVDLVDDAENDDGGKKKEKKKEKKEKKGEKSKKKKKARSDDDDDQ